MLVLSDSEALIVSDSEVLTDTLALSDSDTLVLSASDTLPEALSFSVSDSEALSDALSVSLSETLSLSLPLSASLPSLSAPSASDGAAEFSALEEASSDIEAVSVFDESSSVISESEVEETSDWDSGSASDIEPLSEAASLPAVSCSSGALSLSTGLSITVSEVLASSCSSASASRACASSCSSCSSISAAKTTLASSVTPPITIPVAPNAFKTLFALFLLRFFLLMFPPLAIAYLHFYPICPTQLSACITYKYR